MTNTKLNFSVNRDKVASFQNAQMIFNLIRHIIFIHGLSGSGKGEIYKKLSEVYSSRGYHIFYLSSGALFREALSNPAIAEQVRKGYFLDTLGAIMPSIENSFQNFFKKWAETTGKSIIILDGLIRRGAFINEQGVQIPSQIEQLSAGIDNALEKLLREDGVIRRYFPEYNTSLGKEERIARIKQTLTESNHIVTDVLPEDAERQIVGRAIKEITSIKDQLRNKSAKK